MCFSVELELNLKSLSKKFQAEIDQQSYEQFYQRQEKAPRHFKEPADDGRIYPNYFAPVIIWQEGKRVIRPMRYRVRPAGSVQEIPSKYNVFNARLDSLETRATWRPLFMRKHCLLPFKSFFEWVEDSNQKKVLINFRAQEHSLLWAPGLWDSWRDPLQSEGQGLESFAIITQDPPPEILAQGHDRCPIILREECVNDWLDPGGRRKGKGEIYQILEHPMDIHFVHHFEVEAKRVGAKRESSNRKKN